LKKKEKERLSVGSPKGEGVWVALGLVLDTRKRKNPRTGRKEPPHMGWA